MQILEETTAWPDNTPNHAYAINDSGKAVAYRRAGSDQWVIFGKPLMFSKSHRKFRKVSGSIDDLLSKEIAQ